MKRFRAGLPDLAAIRSGRGISLETIAASTKIGLFYLQAIEKGDIRKLPGGVYSRSYVRQYAEAIDYDEEELLDRIGLETPKDLNPKARAGGRHSARIFDFFADFFAPLVRHNRTNRTW